MISRIPLTQLRQSQTNKIQQESKTARLTKTHHCHCHQPESDCYLTPSRLLSDCWTSHRGSCAAFWLPLYECGTKPGVWRYLEAQVLEVVACSSSFWSARPPPWPAPRSRVCTGCVSSSSFLSCCVFGWEWVSSTPGWVVCVVPPARETLWAVFLAHLGSFILAEPSVRKTRMSTLVSPPLLG